MASTAIAANPIPVDASVSARTTAANPAANSTRCSPGATSAIHSHNTIAAAAPQNSANGQPPR